MFQSPMLLQQVDEPFDNPEYLYEPKADGIRLEYTNINNKVRFFTRHGNDITYKFPELHSSPNSKDVILDGELVVVDPQTGIVDFELCMKRFSASNERTIHSMLSELPAIFIVFDILYYDGKNLKRLPLIERKQILSEVVPKTVHFQPIIYMENMGTTLFEALSSSPFLEGIVAKKKNSTYVNKRSYDWLKVIDYKFSEAVILGYKKKEFGWLLGIEDKGKYRSMGVMELGTNNGIRKHFYQNVASLKQHQDKDYVYIEPKVTCKVKYRNLTRKGYFRSPVFVSWNE